MNDTDLLATVPIFSSLSHKELASLRAYMTKRSYSKHWMILHEGGPGGCLFIITRGKVKVSRYGEDGREVILALLTEGDFFGETSLLEGTERSACCVALEAVELLIFKKRHFLLLLEAHPEVACSLISEMARRTRQSYHQIESLLSRDAPHRIGLTLVRVTEELGTIQNGRVKVTNLPLLRDIAGMAGTSRETVSRVLRVFREAGMLQREGRQLFFQDYRQFKQTFSRSFRQ